MTDTDIVIDGGYPGGWLDTLTNFEFPSNVAVLTFNVSWTGDSQSSSNVPYSDKPIVTVSGQGGNAQASVLAGGTQMLNKGIAISAFPPFSKEDTSSFPLPDFYDYQTATVLYGLRGGGYPRGGGVFSGAHSQDVMTAAFNAISAGLMAEFGWDLPTTINNMVGLSPLLDFMILDGSAPRMPPIYDPKLYDLVAVTTLVPGGHNDILQDWHNLALVIPLSPYKGTGKTISISMNIAKPPHGNTYTWVAGVATYKKAQKGWQKAPPSGWNIGKETYPTYAGYPWHRTQGYNLPLLGGAKGSVDTQELHDLSGGATVGRTIKFTIDAKILGITTSG